VAHSPVGVLDVGFFAGPPDPVGDGPQFPPLGLLEQLLAVLFREARLFSSASSMPTGEHLLQAPRSIPIYPPAHALVADTKKFGHLTHWAPLAHKPEGVEARAVLVVSLFKIAVLERLLAVLPVYF
jgi:hypothetical protein